MCQAKLVQFTNHQHGSHGTQPHHFFEGNCRGLPFAICMDGLNPFSNEKTSYSTCPIFLTILNLPHEIRMLSASAMLTGLIPGPSEPKNTNAYVDVLIDDIMTLDNL